MKKIRLTQGKFAVIDDDDFERVTKAGSWFAHYDKSSKKWYVVRSQRHEVTRRNQTFYLHRFILNAPKSLQVDHKNGDSFDNRKKNLRLATHAENSRNKGRQSSNTSGYKGVTKMKKAKRWTAQIHFNNKKIYVGHFDSKIEAAKAYDEAARKLHGEFAKLNFPKK